MTPLLESFLNRIPNEFPNMELTLSGPKVENKLKEISKRFPDLEYPKRVGLAILLQQVNLTDFPDDELLEVSQLEFKYLESIVFPELKNKNYIQPSESPLYDTGSSRVYNFIDVEEVAVRSLQVKFAHFNYFEAETLKELITTLYTLGV